MANKLFAIIVVAGLAITTYLGYIYYNSEEAQLARLENLKAAQLQKIEQLQKENTGLKDVLSEFEILNSKFSETGTAGALRAD